MIEAVEQAGRKHDFHLRAYAIMAEHVHLLTWLGNRPYSISAMLKTIKQSVARTAIEFVKDQAPDFLPQMWDCRRDGTGSHRFWQGGGGYDRTLTEPKTIWSTMEYIHANPVRRGLCRHATDWLWSSAPEWEHLGTGLLSIDRNSAPRTDAG
jgi:putative transposase